MKYYSFN